jgi:DNA-binding transcriptional regulator YiaG
MSDRPTSKPVIALKAWCVAHRVKQTELAGMLGVSSSAVTEWFKGRSHPKGELTVKILEMVKRKPPPGAKK